MENAKLDVTKKPTKGAGGRPTSEGWELFSFSKIDVPKGKCLAKCLKCQKILQNTSRNRMANHRKKCGQVTVTSEEQREKQAQKCESQDKPEENFEVADGEGSAILWSQGSTDQFETYTVPVVVESTAAEILSGEFQRSKKSRKRRRSSESSASYDTALSSFLIGCNLTFDVIDSTYFKTFIQLLKPDWQLPTSSQLKSRLLSQLQTLDSSRSKRKSRRESFSSRNDSD